MIAAVVGNQALPPIIFTPQYRRVRNVKGINGDMLVNFIQNVSKIEQALCNGGCTGLREVLVPPTQAAKLVSSLENTLFHEWKERIRKHSLLTEDTLVSSDDR